MVVDTCADRNLQTPECCFALSPAVLPDLWSTQDSSSPFAALPVMDVLQGQRRLGEPAENLWSDQGFGRVAFCPRKYWWSACREKTEFRPAEVAVASGSSRVDLAVRDLACTTWTMFAVGRLLFFNITAFTFETYKNDGFGSQRVDLGLRLGGQHKSHKSPKLK